MKIAWGDVSLVRSRSLVIDEEQLIEDWHRRRLELKTGMTRPWQILGAARVPLRTGRDRLPVRCQLVAVGRRQRSCCARSPTCLGAAGSEPTPPSFRPFRRAEL